MPTGRITTTEGIYDIEVEYNRDINTLDIGSGGSAQGDYIPTPTTAQVGDILKVKAIDENGKPTEWECAKESGGSGGGSAESSYPITPQIDITLEEAVRTMAITTINGVPLKNYKFTAMRVYVVNSVQAEKVTSEFIINIDSAGKKPYLSAGTGFICATSQQYWGGGIDLKNAFAWNIASGLTSPIYRTNIQSSSNPAELIKTEQFEELVIKSVSTDIPAGTHIQIWFK